MNHKIIKSIYLFALCFIFGPSFVYAEGSVIKFPSCNSQISGDLSESTIKDITSGEYAQYLLFFEPEVVFHVMCLNIPEKTLKNSSTEKILDKTTEIIIKSMNKAAYENSKITEQKVIHSGDYQGKSITLLATQLDTKQKTNVFLKGQFLIGITMVGKQSKVESQEVQSIFNSFEIL